jgi:hypothetical protein
VSVHAGDGEPDSSATGPGPSPALATDEPLTITLSDLKLLVGVVDAAVALYNRLDTLPVALEYSLQKTDLKHALDALGVRDE